MELICFITSVPSIKTALPPKTANGLNKILIDFDEASSQTRVIFYPPENKSYNLFLLNIDSAEDSKDWILPSGNIFLKQNKKSINVLRPNVKLVFEKKWFVLN